MKILAILLVAVSACAQSTAARVTGTVTDPSGGAIPGAGVVATNIETGWTTSATAGAEGHYVLFPLPPGVYRIDVSKDGFRNARVDQLQLYAGDIVARNVRLEVAGMSQAVTVTDAALALNETPSVENTVTEEQVANLPLNGRDYNQLVFLGGGSVDSTGFSYDLGSAAINGNRSYSNEYSIDGVTNTATWQNTSAVGLSSD